eukprot:10005470-Alexandrium_andersonii.AAC.1
MCIRDRPRLLSLPGRPAAAQHSWSGGLPREAPPSRGGLPRGWAAGPAGRPLRGGRGRLELRAAQLARRSWSLHLQRL